MSAPDPLAAFHVADPPYQRAREELRALQYTRDHALLEACQAGLDEEEICAATGLEPGALCAALARASATQAAGELMASEPASSGDTVTLTAAYEADEQGRVRARLLEWPGVITAGRDRREAAVLLRDAAREWLLSLGEEARRESAGPQVAYESIEVAIR